MFLHFPILYFVLSSGVYISLQVHFDTECLIAGFRWTFAADPISREGGCSGDQHSRKIYLDYREKYLVPGEFLKFQD